MDNKNILVNDVPNPETISKDKNEEIKKLIYDEFVKKGKIEYFDMIGVFQKYIENKEEEYAMICAYYIVNVIINSKDIDKKDKINYINDIKRLLLDMKY